MNEQILQRVLSHDFLFVLINTMMTTLFFIE